MTSTRNTGHAPFAAAVGAAGRASMNASSSTLYSLIGGFLVLSAGCSSTATVANSPKPFEVRVVQVQQRDVPLYQEWIGTLDGFVNADIKGAGVRLPGPTGVYRRLLCQDRPIALSNRLKAVSGHARPDASPTRAVTRPSRGGPCTIGAGRSTGGSRGSEPRSHTAGRGSLYSARATGSDHAAGSGQRNTEQPGRQGAATGRHGASRDRQGSDHCGRGRGAIIQSRH